MSVKEVIIEPHTSTYTDVETGYFLIVGHNIWKVRDSCYRRRKNMGSITEERIALKLDDRLKAIYEEIGKKFYSENKERELQDELYQKLFEEIKKNLKERNALEEKKLALQGKKRCISRNYCDISTAIFVPCGI